MSDIVITPANVLASGSGSPAQAIFGVAITQGKVVYKDSTGKYQLSDSNGASALQAVDGIALNAGSLGQPATIVTTDPALNVGAVLTAGDVIYLSDTPGGMTNVYSDIASGSKVITLGVANTDGTLNFRPVIGGLKP